MDQESFERHKPFAGKTKPSMLRRRVGHDYASRRIYLITMTTEGRRPLFGRVTGDVKQPPESAEGPHIELSPLGLRVAAEWEAIPRYHPEVSVIAMQMMPDHLHGILFVHSPLGFHLGRIIGGFKASTNKAYRELVLGQGKEEAAAAPQQSEPQAQQNAPQPQAQQNAPQPQPQQSAPQPLPQHPLPQQAHPQQSAPQPPHSGAKRDRSHESREHGMLWTLGYNDHILSGNGELERWVQYLRNNPKRLLLKRLQPDLFRVSFNHHIGGHVYAALGNRFLLERPLLLVVQCSRRLTEAEIGEQVAHFLNQGRHGAVLVSPAISPGEKRVMRAAMDARIPLIFLASRGLNAFSKPGCEYLDACAEGRLLIISPWEYQTRDAGISREMCLHLNWLARTITDNPK